MPNGDSRVSRRYHEKKKGLKLNKNGKVYGKPIFNKTDFSCFRCNQKMVILKKFLRRLKYFENFKYFEIFIRF